MSMWTEGRSEARSHGHLAKHVFFFLFATAHGVCVCVIWLL